ncbi:MAG: hypothetical protein HY827_10230 [Actinobacteria bacterium]|nr:hypothetical protein [Actinomycetota bacterium]
MHEGSYSKTQVTKAGDIVREVGPEIDEEANRLVGFSFQITNRFSPEEVLDAVTTVQRYRDGHSDAQRLVHRELAVAFAAAGFAISSRQKRLQAIADKLQRISSRLPQMADIAGCRVVVEQIDAIHEVAAHVREGFDVIDVDDYLENGKPVGYRALHLIVEIPDSNPFMAEDSRGAKVEIQVRTKRQNEWADQIERVTGTTGYDLKTGDVSELPAELVEYVKVASDIRWLADNVRPVDMKLESRLKELRESVRKYF